MKYIALLLIFLPLSSYAQDYDDHSKDYLYGRMYNEADYYFKLKQLNKTNRIHPTAPSPELLQKLNYSRLPYKLTEQDYSKGVINWPEFFLMGNTPEVLDIDRAMAGEMGFWDNMVVRRSVEPLRDRLYQYRYLLSGNEKIRYMKFLEGLKAHQFYEEKKQNP